MDVDQLARPARDEPVGQDLHVTGQHHQLDAQVTEQDVEFLFLIVLGLGCDREMVEREPEAFGDVTGIRVIADHGGDLGRDVPHPPPAQQVEEAVGLAGEEYRRLLRDTDGVGRPLGLQVGGDGLEAGSEPFQVQTASVEMDPLVEPGVRRRLALLGAQDVPPQPGDVTGDPTHDPGAVGACQQEHDRRCHEAQGTPAADDTGRRAGQSVRTDLLPCSLRRRFNQLGDTAQTPAPGDGALGLAVLLERMTAVGAPGCLESRPVAALGLGDGLDQRERSLARFTVS